MKNYKKLTIWLLGMSFVLGGGLCSAQSDVKPTDFDAPAVTFYKNPSKWFSCHISRIEGSGPDTVWVEFTKGGELMPFYIPDTNFVQMYNYKDTLQLETFDTVRIYTREPEKIGRIKSTSYEITGVDLSHVPGLYWLDLNYNSIETIDLSHCPDLIFLILNANRTLKKLDVTKNPKLQYLNVEFCGLTELDVTKNKNLLHLDFGSNQIPEINLDSNTNLYELLLSATPIKELNTSIFPNLQYLSIGYSYISKIDLTKNTNLYMLYASGLKGEPVTYIDVTQCPHLLHFFAMSNALDSVNFSNNPNLQSVYISQNNLKTIDVSLNPDLIELICWRNQLTFATLPTQDIAFYTYSPQADLEIAQSYSTGEVIDLSGQLEVNGTKTSYVWKTGTQYPYVELKEGLDYKIDGGKTVFLKGQQDPVFCEMKNELFPVLTLKSTPTNIKGGVAVENPSAAEYTITASSKTIQVRHAEGYRISVYDMRGVCLNTAAGCAFNEIPVLNAGLYLVRLERNGQSATRKVVVR